MSRRALLLVALAWALLELARTSSPAVPSCTQIRARHQPSDARVLDRHGEVVHELRIDATRRRFEWVPLEQISPTVLQVVVVAEDRRFYRHRGVDLRALARATGRSLAGRRTGGASTITMQLATLLDDPPSQARIGQARRVRRGIAGKWRQMRLAWAIERQWSKAEILEAYLNLATFRGELEGIGAAAAVLFGKAPHGLSHTEALILAALLRAPNAPPETVLRRAVALARAMHESTGDDELRSMVRDRLTRTAVASGSGPRISDAPHLAERLLRSREASSSGPATVRATLDASLQRAATEILERNLLALRGRNVRDGAVLVADNASGEVLAYVGGSGDLSSARHVDGVQARRQAGSSLKPFLYALALDRRLLTAASLLEDSPLEIPVATGIYRPRNYDERFRGLVSARTALAASLNVPAVRALVLLGEEPFVGQLSSFGFIGLIRSGEYYGPALALGSADVSLYELVNAYRTLARGGSWSRLRVTPAGDRVAAERGDTPATERGDTPATGRTDTPATGPEAFGGRVVSEAAAFIVADVLADRESRSGTFGLESPLATRFWTAVKTGTSKDMRDNWCVGFSRDFTVGVWVGNFSGEPMHDVSGVSGAAPAWLEIMERLHAARPSPRPLPPPGVVLGRVAFPDGLEPERDEWFVAGTEPPTRMQTLAMVRARILSPTRGSIIAIDPDVPPSRQRLLLEASTPGDAHWVLDRTPLGRASAPVLWEPRPGTHVLSLVGASGAVLDAVSFEVRGTRDSRRVPTFSERAPAVKLREPAT